MDSIREKTSASNEPICKEEKAEFLIALIAIDCSRIANDCFDCNQLFPPWSVVFFSKIEQLNSPIIQI
jgi:hypothetical protein